jgi:hypothetical protein
VLAGEFVCGNAESSGLLRLWSSPLFVDLGSRPN